MVRILFAVTLAVTAVASQFVGRLARGNESGGEFPGAPVRIQSPGSETTSLTVTLNLTRGAFAIRVFKDSTQVPGTQFMRQGTYQRDLSIGESVLLVPEPAAAGTYSVRVGDEPFVGLRQWTLTLCMAGILMLIAPVMGAKVERVIRTNLMGEQMRVIFRSLPPSAVPWMSAAAIVGATLWGIGLMLWWYRFGHAMPWRAEVALFALGVSLLANNFILILDPGHMLALVEHLSMTGAAARTVSRGPALVSAAVLLYLVVSRCGMLPGVLARESRCHATVA